MAKIYKIFKDSNKDLMINNQDLLKIENIIKYKFKNKDLLKKCFLHSSLFKKNKNNADSISDYERLEFLGDRVLGLLIAYLIFDNFPNYSEGKMSVKLSYLVQRNFLSKISTELKLYKFLKMSKDQNINLKESKSILADTLESLIGAIFIDGGFNESKKFVKKIWSNYIIDENTNLIDPKTVLQELSQRKSKLLPIYKLIEKKGPPHSPIFRVEVSCLNQKGIIGKGTSKREAERIAAESFLKKYKSFYEK